MKNKSTWSAIFVLALFLSLTPVFAAPVIPRGVDVFTTLANGNTSYSFAQNPIPAGFFCKRSAPFTGKIVLRGVPLATDTPGGLRNADTVIERLDDATFDENGVATTRLRFKALSLASVRPVQTACGSFHVYVSLADNQRTTTMKIERTSELGGIFTGPLAVDARMTFVPVRATKRVNSKLTLVGSFTFPSQPLPWMHEVGAQTKRLAGSARVDTNGDQIPDALVAGTTNFHPGWTPADLIEQKVGAGCRRVCEPEECHTDAATGKIHCTGPLTTCCNCGCP